MRLRKIKGADEHIEQSVFVIQNPEEQKGIWKEKVFGNKNPIHLEIGSGKGLFLTTLATQNPNVNYLGIEKFSSVLLRAVEKRETMEDCRNLYFLNRDAAELLNYFDTGEVNRIYLNFSDPWPKDRHAKRRLTSREFLECYEKILSPDGILQFKTDNRSLFEFSLKELEFRNWEIRSMSEDLYRSDKLAGNVPTEYEIRFHTLGNPIYYLQASVRKA